MVTGASTGIGRHVAVQLMKDNYAVLAGVRKESDKQSLINEAAGIFSGKGEFTGGLLLPGIQKHCVIAVLVNSLRLTLSSQ